MADKEKVVNKKNKSSYNNKSMDTSQLQSLTVKELQVLANNLNNHSDNTLDNTKKNKRRRRRKKFPEGVFQTDILDNNR